MICAVGCDLRRCRPPASVAEAAARLLESQQHALACHLDEAGGPYAARVRAQSFRRGGAAASELPDDVFAERAAARQRTVRGHLLAATDAIPDEPNLLALSPWTGR